MKMPRGLVENALGGAITASLPIISRIPGPKLLRMVPRLPVAASTGCQDLRELASRNVSFLSLLKHLKSRERPGLKRARIRNYIINPIIASQRQRERVCKRLGHRGIGALVLTPSVECNLDCELCYNKHHTRPEARLDLDTMDRVVKEAKELGAYRVSVIGGEPLLLWHDVLLLAQSNPEVLFTIMTNGQLLTPEMAEGFAERGNVELSFSIDGLRETNDRLRGAGTFDQILAAMELYRSAGGMVLYSPTITSENYEEVLSDEFIDLMLAKGAYMGYHHHYYLVGGQNRAELLLSAEQRRWVAKRIAEVHASKPIILFDNVESQIFRGGCQAVNEYVHVNHEGYVEPCCMVQFAQDSVHSRSLGEILGSEFFQQIRCVEVDCQGIKRCLVGENHEPFETIVDQTAAAPTGPHALDVFDDERTSAASKMPTCFCSS